VYGLIGEFCRGHGEEHATEQGLLHRPEKIRPAAIKAGTVMWETPIPVDDKPIYQALTEPNTTVH
jgi:hypothetical protein